TVGLSIVAIAALLFVAFRGRTERYSPGDEIEGITSDLDRGLPAGYPTVLFSEVARAAGIDFVHFPATRSTQLPEDMGSGAAWGDYDNDGDADLFLANIAASNKLYRNNGNSSFTDVTAAAGLEHTATTMGAAWADYNRDGHLDLVVTTVGRVLLYRNSGGGEFDEVSETAGLAGDKRFWAGASWGDFDGDGDLDPYICAYVSFRFDPDLASKTSRQFTSDVPFTLNPSSYPAEPNALFRNNGDGTFTDVAPEAGVANPTGRSLTASWCDFDLDGRLDVYIANDVSDNAMYRNLGNGRFEDVSHAALVSDYRGAMGLAVADYDNDTDPDIFITHWIAQENALLWNMLRGPAGGGSEALRFTDIADMMGLGQKALHTIGWGASFFDYDNDGQLDLFVSNGSTFQREDDPSLLVPMQNFLLWQKSPEDGFFDTGVVSGDVFAELNVSRGAAFADYDTDGDVDFVVIQHGAAPHLLRNDGGNRGKWLRVRAPLGA
ncbi:MAG: VCBS repeat-containing protein, partial [bacterium]|nr:VCBS repeat-containing protein [bacterium]